MPEEQISIPLLQRALAKATDYDSLKDSIVSAPFEQPVATTFMFLGFVTLLIVDLATKLIDRVAISKTELADNAKNISVVAFENIKIPLDDTNNIIARAIRDKKSYDTTDWYYTFTPALTAEQAHLNQASAGIAYTAIYPLDFPNGGVISYSYYQYPENIDSTQRNFMEKYAELIGAALAKHYPN